MSFPARDRDNNQKILILIIAQSNLKQLITPACTGKAKHGRNFDHQIGFIGSLMHKSSKIHIRFLTQKDGMQQIIDLKWADLRNWSIASKAGKNTNGITCFDKNQ